MRSERQSDMQTPFGVLVEGTVINDVAMVQQAFGVVSIHQDGVDGISSAGMG